MRLQGWSVHPNREKATAKVELQLSNGGESPDDVTSSEYRGPESRTLGPFDWVHVPYMSEVRAGHVETGVEIVLKVEDGWVHYDNKVFGDWSVEVYSGDEAS